MFQVQLNQQKTFQTVFLDNDFCSPSCGDNVRNLEYDVHDDVHDDDAVDDNSNDVDDSDDHFTISGQFPLEQIDETPSIVLTNGSSYETTIFVTASVQRYGSIFFCLI